MNTRSEGMSNRPKTPAAHSNSGDSAQLSGHPAPTGSGSSASTGHGASTPTGAGGRKSTASGTHAGADGHAPAPGGLIASARALRRSGSAPVNKGVGQAGARIPQIDNPLLLGALGLAAVGAGAALAVLRPSRRGGRTARFRSLALGALAGAPSGPSGRLELADLQVQEGFGKPTLVSFDVLVDGLGDGGEAGRDRAQGTTSALVNEPDAEPPADSTPPAQVAVDIGPLLLDAFDRLVQAIWDNPEIAPVAIRGRLLSPSGTRPLADMTSLGFDGEIARPADLYEHYGSPASDRRWRP